MGKGPAPYLYLTGSLVAVAPFTTCVFSSVSSAKIFDDALPPKVDGTNASVADAAHSIASAVEVIFIVAVALSVEKCI